MSKTLVSEIHQMIKENEVKFVDLRFTDTYGKLLHITVDIRVVDNEFLLQGKMFDGSSVAGWRTINDSDMILRPDLNTAFIDPFFEECTLVIICNVMDPVTNESYIRDPRAVAARTENYLKSTGLGDISYFGPEPEFFIFDSVQWNVDINTASFEIDSVSGVWNSNKKYEDNNTGHRPRIKGGYLPTPPIDAFQDIRSAMSTALNALGFEVETHHHEVGTAGQSEINLRYNSLLNKADEMMIFKYVIPNVAHTFGKTVTFMPKPLAGDNGSGMHCHISIFKGGKNLFSGNSHAGLSPFALSFIAGIIKHARALNAFTNPSTNSYKRLVPGFEAPVSLAYSARNRSASIRIPHVHNAKERRIEVRFPDPLANPYLAFSALIMAGLDGVHNQLDPGLPLDKDLYDLSQAELHQIPTLCASLGEALKALAEDHQFLLAGDVFSEDLIKAYIALKEEEASRLSRAPHPVEFEMYYS